MAFTIRLALEEEIDQIVHLQTLSLKELSQQKYSEEQISVLVRTQDEGRRWGFETRLIAELEDGFIVGFAALSDNQPYINGIYVHPQFVRQGIGSSLLKELEGIALRRKYKTLKVISSLVATGFYLKNDFSMVRKYQLATGEGSWIPSELLEKELIPLTWTEKHRDLVTLGGMSSVFIISLIISLM